jgi:uncharacterized protein YdeI (YjbR/CyaY-like superfamily)
MATKKIGATKTGATKTGATKTGAKDAASPAPIAFASRAEFAAFLEAEGARSGPIWIRFAKKGSGIASLTYAEAVEVALCHGWIDAQSRRLDDRFYVQWFGPRRPKSLWSKINVAKAEALIAAGEMRPGGLAEIERAKADGRWQAAYSSPKTAAVPADLEAALAKNAKAKRSFSTLDATNRYAIIHRIEITKTATARGKRIAGLVEMLAEGRTPHPRP